MKIFAAVIEWPELLSDAEPGLVLAHSVGERDEMIAAEIRETAGMLAEPDWRDALADAGDDWLDWMEPLELTSYGNPFVSTYEREV